jgi:23S rRNA pseudouridine1911/1915/1917 synthase
MPLVQPLVRHDVEGRPPRLLLDEGAVLALDKPPGVSMATSSRPGKAEADVVARLLEACGLSVPPVLPLLVHRLDEGTSGVVLLARDAATHRLLSLAFQERAAHKTYRALVWGHPVPSRGLADAPLARDPKDGRKMAVREGGKPAATRWRTLRRYPSVADLELTPETGRTHQIRVHLSARGHPIVGDDFYGGATRWRGVRDPVARAAFAAVSHPLLHAARVVVAPLGIDVEAPLPADYAALLAILAG